MFPQVFFYDLQQQPQVPEYYPDFLLTDGRLVNLPHACRCVCLQSRAPTVDQFLMHGAHGEFRNW